MKHYFKSYCKQCRRVEMGTRKTLADAQETHDLIKHTNAWETSSDWGSFIPITVLEFRVKPLFRNQELRVAKRHFYNGQKRLLYDVYPNL